MDLVVQFLLFVGVTGGGMSSSSLHDWRYTLWLHFLLGQSLLKGRVGVRAIEILGSEGEGVERIVVLLLKDTNQMI